MPAVVGFAEAGQFLNVGRGKKEREKLFCGGDDMLKRGIYILTFHVMVNGFPTGTIWFRVGWPIGFPPRAPVGC